MFNNPIGSLNLRRKIRTGYYYQLQEIYNNTKTALQFIDDNHTQNYNRVMNILSYNHDLPILSSNLNFSKADIQKFLNNIRAEYAVDCQMTKFLKHNLQKDYEIYQKFGLNIKAIDELLTTDSQAQKQLGQLLTALTNTLNAK